ncbi:MAG: peptidoglycan-binding protein [Cyanobacteria bacterium CRU_2_1]|nr:peptidoglycan-binding protein [Cyanobacteria bacterium RU_5_0]NJR60174.1 peptidoglycan-binding protein [Cyanobacteria bacterium CRU_2_1]
MSNLEDADGEFATKQLNLKEEFQVTVSPTNPVDYEQAVDPVLRLASQGAAVVELQKLLNQNGANLVVDGYFGRATETAVIKFQREHGQVADGVVGATTWAELRKVESDVYIVMPIYEYYAETPVWRYRYSNTPNLGQGWKKSGVGFYSFAKSQSGTIPIYQYSAQNPWRYQYSDTPNIEQGWFNEGVAFYAYKQQAPNTIPVYQHSAQNPWRFQYSTNPNIGGGWKNDGPAFYVLAAKPV